MRDRVTSSRRFRTYQTLREFDAAPPTTGGPMHGTPDVETQSLAGGGRSLEHPANPATKSDKNSTASQDQRSIGFNLYDDAGVVDIKVRATWSL